MCTTGGHGHIGNTNTKLAVQKLARPISMTIHEDNQAAIKVVSDSLQMFGARGYGGEEPLERMYRDVRMFTIGGGTAQILRTQIAGKLLDIRTPQTRAGYSDAAAAFRAAGE